MYQEVATGMLTSADPQAQVRTRRQNPTGDEECRFTSTIRKVTFYKIPPGDSSAPPGHVKI
jgi:hypothetical protein